MKDKGTVKIDILELDQYVKVASDSVPNPLTDWMALKSQLQVKGLKSFHDALSQEPLPPLDTIKAEYSVLLLNDLELVSKRRENNSVRRQMPKFKKEFYEELRLPFNERSKEYKEFVTEYSKLDASTHAVEAISAKALLDLDNPESSITSIKTNLK